MSHHLTICFARQRNQRQTIFMANNSGVVRKNGKGSSPINTKWEIGLSTPARTSIWTFLGRFLGPIFWFSSIVFSMKNERLITGKEKWILGPCLLPPPSCIGNSLYFPRKDDKNWKGAMIVVVRSYWKIALVQKFSGWLFHYQYWMRKSCQI